MELRSGASDPEVGGLFFILIVDNITYMWEDLSRYIEEPAEGEVLAKWCKWPEDWHPLRPNEVCSEEHFNSTTGHDFKETVRALAL